MLNFRLSADLYGIVRRQNIKAVVSSGSSSDTSCSIDGFDNDCWYILVIMLKKRVHLICACVILS